MVLWNLCRFELAGNTAQPKFHFQKPQKQPPSTLFKYNSKMADWDTGIFDCFSDIKILLISWIFGTCSVAYQKAAIEGHECAIADFIPVFFCSLCCMVKVRGQIREKYGIDGTLLNDILMSWCCGICAVAQQTRQLDMKGAKPAGCFMDK